MRTDIEIARSCTMQPITKIAEKVGLTADELECYGKYKAKVRAAERKPKGKLILVSAITPTPAGEGKTTTSVGLADGLSQLGLNTSLCLREPSLGPVFGVKGGAAGGGMAQVVPMEDINLHFTGDIHAVTAANNLLAALLDNHIHHGNALDIDVRAISWKRCLDMNDRALRDCVVGLGGKPNGFPRQDKFEISVASEVMAILCLATDMADLKERLGRIVVAYNRAGEPVTAGDLRAQGSMAALLRDAILPNLVQTMEHTPAFIHGGPFANIAHGCNSVSATKLALSLTDYVVTEAGFGADLGAEKFIDIKCRSAGIAPSVCVIVATMRALKFHGGVEKKDIGQPNVDALVRGLDNLWRHYDNVTQKLGVPAVVAINRFGNDSQEEIAALLDACAERGVPVALAEGHAQGGKGMMALAQTVIDVMDKPTCGFVYDLKLPLKDKVIALTEGYYGAASTAFMPAAEKELARLQEQGFGDLPVCIAKTQYSFSDTPTLRNAPSGFAMTVRGVKLSAGAGFVVVMTGDMITMPGLPKVPSAEMIDVSGGGEIAGLF
ncbi:MAG: formate--tetrahydrofolate ligase [Oscillospiraceae bacterium]|nr:formate--tetrahydrofolate ligase [Oscillospiraceae bacterium]